MTDRAKSRPVETIAEECFAILELAASAGVRCPPQEDFPSNYQEAFKHLRRHGRIKIEISGRNFRRVTVLTGPCAGRATASDPKGHRIWKMLDAKGTHLIGIEPPREPHNPARMVTDFV